MEGRPEAGDSTGIATVNVHQRRHQAQPDTCWQLETKALAGERD